VGARFEIGNGDHCRFWEDCWLKNVPLKIYYEDLFKMAREPNCFVSDCWRDDSWGMNFKRSLTVQEYNSWLGLLDELNDITLTDNKADKVMWALDKKLAYTTKSLYRFLTDRGVTSRVAGYIWRSKIPLKIKVFLWQMFNNKLQTAQCLVRKGWKGSTNCCLCGCLETVDHIFFKCPMAVFVWSFIKDAFNLDSYPTSLGDFCHKWLMGKKGPLPIKLIIFLFAGFTWTLWNTRNKMAISKMFPKSPSDVVYNALSSMQKWSAALKEKDQERFTNLKNVAMGWLKEFKPTTTFLSDVYEI
jgi:hypothetical protein